MCVLPPLDNGPIRVLLELDSDLDQTMNSDLDIVDPTATHRHTHTETHTHTHTHTQACIYCTLSQSKAARRCMIRRKAPTSQIRFFATRAPQHQHRSSSAVLRETHIGSTRL